MLINRDGLEANLPYFWAMHVCNNSTAAIQMWQSHDHWTCTAQVLES